MRIKHLPTFSGIRVVEAGAGMIFYERRWPPRLLPEHILRALCGRPDEQGWFPYHELDCQWIQHCLYIASQLTQEHMGALALQDHVRLSRTPPQLSMMAFGKSEPPVSQMAAASLATTLISKAFEASLEEAAEIVRMNLFTERVTV